MGTALLARGLPPGALPEEWLLSRPAEIAAVHAEHAAAGAAVLLTCTFSCAAPRLEARLGAGRVGALCEAAVRLAGSAADRVADVPLSPTGRGEGARGAETSASRALVAGAVGPTGLAPPLGPGAAPAVLEARYTRALEALAAAGADLLWIESQHDLGEARAALAAARSVGLPAVLTFGLAERRGRLAPPAGVGDPLDWLSAAEAEGAAAVGVNCVLPGAALVALAAEACARLRVPFVAKPSAGLPGAVLSPDAFAAALRPAIDAGIRLAGGCCGATAAHLRALAPALAPARGR